MVNREIGKEDSKRVPNAYKIKNRIKGINKEIR
jgi:hypothetical protein